MDGTTERWGACEWWPWVAVVIGVYLVLLLFVRYFLVARPSRVHFTLRAMRVVSQAGLRCAEPCKRGCWPWGRSDTAQSAAASGNEGSLAETYREAALRDAYCALLYVRIPGRKKDDWPKGWPKPQVSVGNPVSDFLWLSRGQVGAAYASLHAAETSLRCAEARERIFAKLPSVAASLASSSRPGADAQARAIKAFITRTNECPEPINGSTESQARALTEAALRVLDEDRDRVERVTAGWQRRAFFLTLVCVGFVFVLGTFWWQPFVLLFGALGALLSRLRHTYQSPSTPTSFPSLWSSLLLSVSAGAVLGFAGVVLAGLAVQLRLLDQDTFGSLDDVLVRCGSARSFPVLALALLFGYLEGFFDRMANRVADGTSPDATDPASGAGSAEPIESIQDRSAGPAATTKADPDESKPGAVPT